MNANTKSGNTTITTSGVDENMSIFVYGSVVIRDVETDKILIKKSF